MYSLSQVKRGLRRGVDTPAVFAREFNRLYHRRLFGRDFNTRGVDIPEADWDNLLLLDACRYDCFRLHHDLPGRLEHRESRGSHTVEFLKANFGGRDLMDTVYVTSSPQLYRWREDIDAQFHAVTHVWKAEGWDAEYNTVLPRTMGKYAREAAEEYPHKRLIVHFMQPHYPFIKRGRELSTGRLMDPDGTEEDLWGKLMRDELDVSKDYLWDAIRDNLKAVLPTVETLLEDLPGRTVVTSDHGNMVGERSSPIPVREWGHPPGIYTEELVTVPWLVYEKGPRKEVFEESQTSSNDSIAEETVTNRLQELGYVE